MSFKENKILSMIFDEIAIEHTQDYVNKDLLLNTDEDKS